MTRHRFRWSGLIFGLLFCAIALNWAVWDRDVLTGKQLSYAFSAVLIVVGVLGVLATFRRPRPAATGADPAVAHDATVEGSLPEPTVTEADVSRSPGTESPDAALSDTEFTENEDRA